MTNRIKPVLRKLIGHEQSSFVPGRQITDNILIYQEVVHSMRNKQGKKGFMIIKIDLEKAYDRLSWDFIRDTLMDVGMNNDWVRNIMACVESPKMRILWNGKQLDQIVPSRGIRQGDSISPYLFVLCMERLSHIIKQEVEKGTWRGIRLSRYGNLLTHLFFADDLVLFAEASQEQIAIISQCLDSFSRASGQRVSLNKSQIFFSKNVNSEEAQRITTLAGIPATNNLGKYLGVPTIHGRVTHNLFTPMLDRMDDRLNGWKAKFLTLAGRQVLAQSVLQTIPYYSMQTIFMPAGIWEEIDKRIRRFIWGGTPETRKCHLVCWETVTKPKKAGGLGIRAAKDMNMAFMAKLGWQFITDKDKLWVKILKGKYAQDKHGIEAISAKQVCSNAWRGMVAAVPVVHKGTKMHVRDGRETRFWKDNWLHDHTPLNLVQTYANGDNDDTRVRDFWDDNRGWKWEIIPTLPTETIQQMQRIVLHDGEGGDECYWSQEATGKFSISSAYFLTHTFPTNMQERIWENLWKLKVPNKIKTFIWVAIHDRIMSNAERRRRGISMNDECDTCPGKSETAEHILRSCSKARDMWRAFASANRKKRWWQLDVRSWIMINISTNRAEVEGEDWPRRFAIIVWWLWRWRCNRIFKDEDVTTQHKTSWIKEAEEEMERAFARQKGLVRLTGGHNTVRLRWEASTAHRFTLNVDGSVKTGRNKAGWGAVLRDNKGVWVGGIACNSSQGESSWAEAEAIVESLSWAWDHGVRDVEIQSDAKNVVQWIHDHSPGRGPFCLFVDKIKWWTTRQWRISFRVIFREQNTVADRLASFGADHSGAKRIFDVCPFLSEEAYFNDLAHITYTRRVVELS